MPLPCTRATGRRTPTPIAQTAASTLPITSKYPSVQWYSMGMGSIRRLSEALWHGPPDDSRAAALELVKRPDPRALAPLVGALGRHGVRHAAADALVALGEPAIPALVAALRRDVAPYSAAVLARLGPLAEPSAFAGATSSNPQVRRYCLLVLAEVAPERSGEVLWVAWADRDCGVRSAASQALERLGVRFSADQLVTAAERCEHGLGHVDVWAFARHRHDPRVRTLLHRLALTPRTGIAAVRVLVASGEVEVARQLLDSDDAVMVRQAAWVAYWDRLPDLQRAAAARTLDRSGSTPDALRAAATVGIGSAVAIEHADELVAIVDDDAEAPAVRAGCLIQVAGSISPERLAELCLNAFESNDWRLRKVAVNTMPSGPLLGGVVESALQDPDASVRYSAECRARRR
jgi:hypothetical protein